MQNKRCQEARGFLSSGIQNVLQKASAQSCNKCPSAAVSRPPTELRRCEPGLQTGQDAKTSLLRVLPCPLPT